MSKIYRGLILILLTMIPFLDVARCPYSLKCDGNRKKTSSLVIYSYNGENFEVEHSKYGIFKNTYLNLEEYNMPTFEGYTFLGWYEIGIPTGGSKGFAIETFEDLEEYGVDYELSKTLPNHILHSVELYPLMVKNDELVNFLETSPLALVNVTLYKVFKDHEESESFKGTLLDTYNETLKFNIEEEGYKLLGCSLSGYSYDYVIKNLNSDKFSFLNLEEKIEYTTNIRIYAYYE